MIDELTDNEIYPGVHYIDNTNYPMYDYAKGTCPKAHKYNEQLITLPIHLKMNSYDCEKVVEIIKRG